VTVQGVLLRRMKSMTLDGKPIIDLPPCSHTRLSAEFSAEEQAFYDELKEQSKAVLRNLQDNSGGSAPPLSQPSALLPTPSTVPIFYKLKGKAKSRARTRIANGSQSQSEPKSFEWHNRTITKALPSTFGDTTAPPTVLFRFRSC
jgi:hypothetical protein